MTSPSNLPTFFLIGAAKAGTTTLYEMLKQHEQVFLPFVKEPAFFCDDEYYARGLDWYCETFYKEAGQQPVRGDATPTYLFWGTKVVPRLKTHYRDELPRIIVIFRDPVRLVHSFYWHSVRDGREALSLRDALAAETKRLAEYGELLSRRGRLQYAYSEIGMYARQLQPYLEVFPKSSFLFLLHEDLGNFSRLAARLWDFLGLEPAQGLKPVVSNKAALPRSRKVHDWLRATSAPKELVKPFIPFRLRYRLKMAAIGLNLRTIEYPAIEPDLAQKLRKHFSADMRRLESIIDRDLSAWHGEN